MHRPGPRQGHRLDISARPRFSSFLARIHFSLPLLTTRFHRGDAVVQVASIEGPRLLRNRVLTPTISSSVCRANPLYFVKYDDGKDVLVEAETQIYFYNLAQQDDSAHCIPKVYDVFNDSGRYFSVMVYVASQTFEAVDPSEAVAISLATSVLRWFLSQPFS